MASLFKFIETTLENVDKQAAEATATLRKKQQTQKQQHHHSTSSTEHIDPSSHRRRIQVEEINGGGGWNHTSSYIGHDDTGHTFGSSSGSSSSGGGGGSSDSAALLMRESEMKSVSAEVDRLIDRSTKLLEQQTRDMDRINALDEKRTVSLSSGADTDTDAANVDFDSTVGSVDLDTQSESLQRENQMMQTNVHALHDEMRQMVELIGTLRQRYKTSVQELCRQERYTQETRERLEQQVSRLLIDKQSTDTELASAVDRKENTILQLEGEISDLLQQLQGKDGIIASLQSQIDQSMNQHLRMERKMADDKKKTQAQIAALELQLHADQERYTSERTEWEQTHHRLQRQHVDLQRDMAKIQEDFNQKLEEMGRLNSMLSVQESELRLKQQELADHKQRAARLLKERDQKIQILEGGTSTSDQKQDIGTLITDHDDDGQGEDGEPYSKYTRAGLIGELEMVKLANEDLTQRFDMMKRQHEAERNTLQLRIKNAEKRLEAERTDASKQQDVIQSLKLRLEEERDERQHEQDRQHMMLQAKTQQLHNLQKEILQLKSQNDQVHSTSSEHNAQVKLLTDHLLQKQAILDTAESEKTALRLQLNKANDRIHELQLISHMGPLMPNYGDLEGVDAGKRQVKRVKHQRIFRSIDRNGWIYRAFDKLDTLTLRSGLVLGRAPFLRIIFFLYCIVVHLFLFFVIEQMTVNITPPPSQDA